ncbi:AraC family transcriptional regulator [Caulobacter segnis]|uniref:Helix-turn-helix, AraC domain protein n=2 Tax=Caulobacter segnis TaxID=88688 RepID=D5VPE4_CAUST|nr:helix-turn-helix domain-containing protein [Caulobacter segnis]ADG12367.1 Helix-turn-helix, AraC domain protein [Caulobacter segnis ATCC 21756]AVQ03954.1 AraC family transcriptional regulator [Caulobacter segnis]
MSLSLPLPRHQAGTRVSPGRRGVADYAEAIAPVFDTRLCDVGPEGPDLWISSVNVGPMLLGYAHMSGGTYGYGRDHRKVAATGLDLILVQIIAEGSDRRQAHRSEVETQVGDVCLLDLSRSFQSEAQTCGNFSLAIPREALAARDRDLDDLHGRVLRYDTPAARLLKGHVETIWSMTGALSIHDAPAVGRSTIDLLAGLALPTSDRQQARRAVSESRLTQIRRFIDANLHEPGLGPEMLSRQFGLSRASLYRLFEPLGGVREHIQGRRLRRVFDALTDPSLRHLPLSQVAEGHGFSAWSSFARAFKARFGMSPGEAREIGAVSAMQAWTAATQDQRLPDWLRTLEGA